MVYFKCFHLPVLSHMKLRLGVFHLWEHSVIQNEWHAQGGIRNLQIIIQSWYNSCADFTITWRQELFKAFSWSDNFVLLKKNWKPHNVYVPFFLSLNISLSISKVKNIWIEFNIGTWEQIFDRYLSKFHH